MDGMFGRNAAHLLGNSRRFTFHDSTKMQTMKGSDFFLVFIYCSYYEQHMLTEGNLDRQTAYHFGVVLFNCIQEGLN